MPRLQSEDQATRANRRNRRLRGQGGIGVGGRRRERRPGHLPRQSAKANSHGNQEGVRLPLMAPDADQALNQPNSGVEDVVEDVELLISELRGPVGVRNDERIFDLMNSFFRAWSQTWKLHRTLLHPMSVPLEHGKDCQAVTRIIRVKFSPSQTRSDTSLENLWLPQEGILPESNSLHTTAPFHHAQKHGSISQHQDNRSQGWPTTPRRPSTVPRGEISW